VWPRPVLAGMGPADKHIQTWLVDQFNYERQGIDSKDLGPSNIFMDPFRKIEDDRQVADYVNLDDSERRATAIRDSPGQGIAHSSRRHSHTVLSKSFSVTLLMFRLFNIRP
jgi:hypothetical protein